MVGLLDMAYPDVCRQECNLCLDPLCEGGIGSLFNESAA